MGKKGGSPPPPPNPRETGKAQTATNVSTTIANAWLANPWQSTPFGGMRVQQRGQFLWFDPLDTSDGKQQALRDLQDWLDANPAPLDDPQAYAQWESQRNRMVAQLAEQYGVNVHSVPLLELRQNLSPEQQRVLDELNRANEAFAETAAEQSEWLRDYLRNRTMDTSGLPDLPDIGDYQAPELDTGAPEVPDYVKTYGTDWSEDRRRVEEALLSRLEDQYAADRERLRSELAAQGIWYGSEAYDRAMDEFNRKWNDARMQAVLAGGKEQSRLAQLEAQRAMFENAAWQQQFADALKARDFSNRSALQNWNAALQEAQLASQVRSQGLQELYAQRGQPINEIISLIHGTQLREPKFISANVQPIPVTDYAGIEAENYRARLDRWKAQQQFGLQYLGMGLGFLGALLSDPRAKKSVRHTGKRWKGLSLVSYRYKGEPADAPKRIGVMASEVERRAPDAVIETPRRGRQRKGLRYVDYGRIAGR